jgi:hypothetical protein
MASGQSLSRRVDWPGILALTASVVLLGLTGFWRMFAHFPGYDDEGYILLTVRAYLEHGRLYSNIYIPNMAPGFMSCWMGCSG